MSPSHNSLGYKAQPESEILPFRSEMQSVVVGASEPTTLPSEVTGLREETVKVSRYSLELYLNACSPTCHG